MLAEDRDRGYDFSTAFSEGVEFVISHIAGQGSIIDRDQWRIALEATEEAWRSAWLGCSGPGDQLTHALIDALEAGKRASNTSTWAESVSAD